LSDGKLGEDLRCFGVLRSVDRYQAWFKWDRRIQSGGEKKYTNCSNYYADVKRADGRL